VAETFLTVPPWTFSLSVRRVQVTSGHSLLDIDDSDLSTECAHHSGEPVRFYCDTCDECVCVLCTFRGQPHSHDHNVLSFSDAASLHKTPLAALLADCRQRLRNARTRYDAVVAFDQLIRKVVVIIILIYLYLSRKN